MYLSSCSSLENQVSEINDPYEKSNRAFFKFNQEFDRYLLNPISKSYKNNVPKKIQKGVSNHLNWISIPNSIINSGLQLEGENFALSSMKFLLNSLTLGIYDLDENETKFHTLDYGSTLAKYNFSEGPFVVVPFLGPKTFRHFSGNIISFSTGNSKYFNEINNYKNNLIPLNIVDKRKIFSNVIDDINSSSDPYVKMKSLYIQNRRRNLLINSNYENNILKKEEEEFEKLLE